MHRKKYYLSKNNCLKCSNHFDFGNRFSSSAVQPNTTSTSVCDIYLVNMTTCEPTSCLQHTTVKTLQLILPPFTLSVAQLFNAEVHVYKYNVCFSNIGAPL